MCMWVVDRSKLDLVTKLPGNLYFRVRVLFVIFYVYFQVSVLHGGGHACGGTLISDRLSNFNIFEKREMRSLNLEIQVNSLKLFAAFFYKYFTFLYFQGAPSHRLNAVRWFPQMRLEFKTNYYKTFLFHFFISPSTLSLFFFIWPSTPSPLLVTMSRPRWGWAIWFWASRRNFRWKSHQTSLEKKVEFKMFPVRQWYVPFCYWQQSLAQVTVNVTKMVKHEDHESFSSPENLCLIEVTADSYDSPGDQESTNSNHIFEKKKKQFQSYISVFQLSRPLWPGVPSPLGSGLHHQHHHQYHQMSSTLGRGGCVWGWRVCYNGLGRN